MLKEKFTILLNGQKQHHQNFYNTKINLEIQCGSNQKLTKNIILRGENVTQKFIWKHRIAQVAKAILSNKANLKQQQILKYNKRQWQSKQSGIGTKTEWSSIETSEINPHIHSQFIFYKRTVKIRQKGLSL